MNYNTNIEKSILSSIIFEPVLFDEISIKLSSEDFYLAYHKHIYDAMIYLNKKGLPLEEEFIKKALLKEQRFNEDALIEVLQANPITKDNLFHYIKEIKVLSFERKISSLASKVMSGDLTLIEELQTLKDNLDIIKGAKKLQKDNFAILNKFDISFEQVENIKFEYLFDNFIVKNEITMISAKPGTGKSLLSVALANMLLIDRSIEQVFYIDGDNSLSTIKNRNIHLLKQQHQNRFRYFVGLEKSELWQVVNTLKKMDLTNTLVVFDSIKNFISGDRDKNKDVSVVMELLKTLRNNGATVIFLHHQNKSKDLESHYAGSSAFAEDTSNAFTLKRNDDKNALILKPFKARVGELNEIAFIYNNNHTLTKIDLAYAKESAEDEEMIQETIEFLQNFRGTPMWSDLWKNLTEQGYDKEKASNIIKAGLGKHWNFYKGERNNQKLYYLIENESVKNTPRTPRTPNIGLYNNLDMHRYTPRTPRTHNIGGFEDIRGDKNYKNSSENSQNRANDNIKFDAVYI